MTSGYQRSTSPEFMAVFRDGLGVSHLPSRKFPEMTRCGFDTEWMEERQHLIGQVARWCHMCVETYRVKEGA